MLHLRPVRDEEQGAKDAWQQGRLHARKEVLALFGKVPVRRLPARDGERAVAVRLSLREARRLDLERGGR